MTGGRTGTPLPYPFRLVAQISTYREGTVAIEAVRSCLDAGLDAVVVCEGPAGPDRLPVAPATVTGIPEDDTLPLYGQMVDVDETDRVYRLDGDYPTDAAKRTAMLEWTKQRFHDRPLWVVLLDGDEVLIHGRYLKDLIQHVIWQDEARGATLTNPDNAPTGGFPVKIIEADGSVSLTRSRLFNAGMIRRFVVSNLIVETVLGSEIRLGHSVLPPTPETQLLHRIISGMSGPQAVAHLDAQTQEFLGARVERLYTDPPGPCEPHIYHRSHLRHPARQHLRLHEQERDEIRRLGYPTGDKPSSDEQRS